MQRPVADKNFRGDGAHADAVQTENASWNLVGQVAPLVVAVIAFPILFRQLGTEGFGILSMCWLIVGYFSLFDLGLGRALTQAVAAHLHDAEGDELAQLVWTGITLLGAIGIAVCLIAFPLIPHLVEDAFRISLPLREMSVRSLGWVVGSVPLVVLTAGLRGVLEGCGKFRELSMLRALLGCALFGVPALVSLVRPELPAVALSLAAVRLAGCIGHARLALRILPALSRRGPNLSHARPLMRFGAWVAVSNVVGPVIIYVDRFVLGAYGTMTDVGYYSASFEVVSKGLVLAAALSGAWFPALAQACSSRSSDLAKLYRGGWNLLFRILFPALLTLVCIAPEGLALWMGHLFAQEGLRVTQWLLLGLLFNSMAQFPYSLIQASGQARLTARLHILELPVYVLFLIALVKSWGVEGAAIAWMLRALLDWLILEFLASRQGAGRLTSLLWPPLSAGLLIACIFLATIPVWLRLIVALVGVCAATIQTYRWAQSIFPSLRTRH